MRDSQRQRVYDAESAIDKGQKFTTVAECQDFVDRVLQRKSLQNKFEGKNPHRMQIEVRDGRGRKRAMANTEWGNKIIYLPRWARTEITILHEMAHHLSPAIVVHHWEFCANLLTLVRNVIGVEKYRELKAQYDTRGVRYKAPRTRQMSPEAHQAAASRLAAARASREVLKGSFAVRVVRDGESRWVMQIAKKYDRLEIAATPYAGAARVWAYESTAEKWAKAIAEAGWKNYEAQVVSLNLVG